jgi:hypothetical protein
MERRFLQVILGLLSLIPLLGLALIWTRGAAAFGALESAVPTALDNQLRYLAGVYFGTVTIPLWWAIPRIETRSQALAVAATGVFLGGIGRLVSMAQVGSPGDASMLVGLVLELVVAPLLLVWQRRIARSA